MKTLLQNIWHNKKINKKIILNFILILILSYIFIFHCFCNLFKYQIVKDIDQFCFFNCDNEKCKKYTKSTRGDQYYLSGNDAYSCLFTVWELSHIIFHIFIGYYLDLRYSLLVGIPFEIFEYIQYDCENYMDITYNTIGAVIGGCIRYNFK